MSIVRDRLKRHRKNLPPERWFPSPIVLLPTLFCLLLMIIGVDALWGYWDRGGPDMVFGMQVGFVLTVLGVVGFIILSLLVFPPPDCVAALCPHCEKRSIVGIYRGESSPCPACGQPVERPDNYSGRLGR